MTRLTTILTACILLAALAAPLHAQTGVQLELQNVPIQDEKLLVVNLHLSGVENLFGAEVQLRYDPARLAVRDDNRRLDGIQISPGPLISADDRFVVTNTANPDTGQINFAFTLLKPAQPISGEGELATVVFEIIGNGPYQVDVTEAQLVSAGLQPIPVTVKNLTLNGQREPMAAPPARTGFTAGQGIAIVGLLLGLLLLAGLVALAVKSNRRPAPASDDAPARQMPASGRSTVRSAALLAQQGSRSLAQGDTQRAYELFSRAIEMDPANVEAWLGKGLMAEQPTEKRICLQRVLALDPTNDTARDELDALLASM